MAAESFISSRLGIALIVVITIIVIAGVILLAIHLSEGFDTPNAKYEPSVILAYFYGVDSPEERTFRKAMKSRKMLNRFKVVIYNEASPTRIERSAVFHFPMIRLIRIQPTYGAYTLLVKPMGDFPHPPTFTVAPFSEKNFISWVQTLQPDLTTLPRMEENKIPAKTES